MKDRTDMVEQANLLTPSLRQVAERIFTHRRISRIDQKLLMSALLSQSTIEQAERNLINLVFDSLRQGRLRVVD